ncbi:hypothetical protein LCGC14_0610750 [marine sediment metagenome]|uniref:Uncharacterized protein n=1 Tax=marine sediment metagenome TaxID=412755 RepID=A0A0F9R7U0_9ZZZZ
MIFSVASQFILFRRRFKLLSQNAKQKVIAVITAAIIMVGFIFYLWVIVPQNPQISLGTPMFIGLLFGLIIIPVFRNSKEIITY